MKRAFAIVGAAVLLAACQGTTPAPETTAGTGTPTSLPPTGTVKPPSAGTTGTTQPPSGTPVVAMAMPGAKSVFFDYDSNVVKDEFRSVVQDHYRFLSANSGQQVKLEGNTDERGSREYNLALGQRRAEAVKKALAVLGIADGRMETVSFGEEKPMAPGHDESAWSKNRRTDIVYKGK